MQLTTEKQQLLSWFKYYRMCAIAAYEEYYAGRSDGYCPHGVYVGGCGIDWMCGACEGEDYSFTQEAYYQAKNHINDARRTTFKIAARKLVDILAENGEYLNKEDRALFLDLYGKLMIRK